MTAKDKAKELVEGFYKWVATPDDRDIEFYKSKQCALICVDEMLEFAYDVEWEKKEEAIFKVKFLIKVKKEIEKL